MDTFMRARAFVHRLSRAFKEPGHDKVLFSVHRDEYLALLELYQDAEQWRALMDVDRIRVIGSSGIPWDASPTFLGERAHICVEFWTHHPRARSEETVQAITWLKNFVNTALAKFNKKLPAQEDV